MRRLSLNNLKVFRDRGFIVSVLFVATAATILLFSIDAALTFLFLGLGIGSWIASVRFLNGLASYFPDPLQQGIRWIHAQSFELFAFLFVGILGITSHFHRGSKKVFSNSPEPILLIHGYLNSGFVWDFHRKLFERKGFGPIYTIDLGNPFHSIHVYAKKVDEKVRAILQETGCHQLTLIGHSMGGLIGYYYAMQNKGKVSKVITIGSPLQGTRVARIGLGQCAREMQIGSNLIREMQDGISNCSDVQFYNIATKTDELIIPYASSIYHTTPGHQYYLDDIGHASMLFSTRVNQKCCEWLRKT